MVYVGVGAPVPLKVYGYDPDLRGSGVSLDYLVMGRLAYSAACFGGPFLLFGFQGTNKRARVSDGHLALRGYAIALGPEVAARIPVPLTHSGNPAWAVGVAFGPTMVYGGFDIDENIREETRAWGLQGRLWLDRRLLGALRMALEVGIDHQFTPIGEATFFNHPLNESTYLTLTLGPQLSF